MKRGGFSSEAALAGVVVAWLRASGHRVFQEVEHEGAVADIVATRGEEVTVVECKLGMSLSVLEQAHRWLRRAHRVYAAVPFYADTTREHGRFARVICETLGIGLLEVVTPVSDEAGRVHLILESPLREPEASRRPLLSVLCPEHETYAAAGSPTGHRWTPFRATEQALVAYVTAHPGVLAREAVKAIKHHWPARSATGRALVLIRSGVIHGVRIEGSAREIRLFPEATPAPEIASTTPCCTPSPPATAPVAPPTSPQPSRTWEEVRRARAGARA